MTAIRVKVKRSEVRPGGLKGLEPDIRAGALDGLGAIGLAMLNHSKGIIQRGAKSGKVYRKGNPKRIHQASAAGQAPATDTGQLVNSGFQNVEAAALEVEIGFDAAHAKHLEYGTRHMGRRPFLSTAVNHFRDRIPGILTRSIKARLK